LNDPETKAKRGISHFTISVYAISPARRRPLSRNASAHPAPTVSSGRAV